MGAKVRPETKRAANIHKHEDEHNACIRIYNLSLPDPTGNIMKCNVSPPTGLHNCSSLLARSACLPPMRWCPPLFRQQGRRVYYRLTPRFLTGPRNNSVMYVNGNKVLSRVLCTRVVVVHNPRWCLYLEGRGWSGGEARSVVGGQEELNRNTVSGQTDK